MGISTLTAARYLSFPPASHLNVKFVRTLKWQRQDLATRDVEEPSLEFEEWPNTALIKTYCRSLHCKRNIVFRHPTCSDHLVADSACSATAYMTGIKGRKDTVGLTEEVKYEDCEGQLEPAHHRHASLLYHAQEAGLATGLVTTDSLTGASPAGGFNKYRNVRRITVTNNRLCPLRLEGLGEQSGNTKQVRL